MGSIPFRNEFVACEFGWTLIEDLRAIPSTRCSPATGHPTLLLQGKLDATVSWKSVLDFAVRCTFQEIEFHLFADGDHRLTDRKGLVVGADGGVPAGTGAA